MTVEPIVAPPHVLIEPERNDVTGEWSYPDTWTPENRTTHEEMVGEIIHHEKAVEAAQAKVDAYMLSPVVMLATKRIALEDAKRSADRVRRQAEGVQAWIEARVRHGANVRKIDMDEEGDRIIMLRMPEAAILASIKRAQDLQRVEMAALPAGASQADVLAAEARGLESAIGAQRDAVIEHCFVAGLDKTASTGRIRELMAAYFGLWPRMVQLRDEMAAGWRAAEGKGSAP